MADIIVLHVDEIFKDSIVFNNNDVVDSLIEKFSPSFTHVVLSLPKDYTGKYLQNEKSFVRSEKEIDDWKNYIKKYDAKNVVKVYADSPFLEDEIVLEMLEIHKKHFAEFTYSENLPEGLSCIIASKEIIDSIPDTGEDILGLEAVVKKNISSFDVELFYKSPDLRSKRINFRIKDGREKAVLEGIYNINNEIPKYQNILSLINQNPDVLYIAPAYYEIEITTQSDITSIYSYRNKLDSNRNEMPLEMMKKIISQADENKKNYTICLGGAGDPLKHSSYYSIMDAILESKYVERLIIETDGLDCDNAFLSYLEDRNDQRINLIVDCSGYNSETYEKIHQIDRFDQIFSNIELLKTYFGDNSSRLYIQVLKINETEEFLDNYYDFWESKKVNIILQKQNIYLGLIDDRRYYDLSPVDRNPCWHLQRDLYVLSDLTVGFCKQDINGKFSKWNFEKQSLNEIWLDKEQYYIKDYKSDFCKEPDCESCDEWYTYNF